MLVTLLALGCLCPLQRMPVGGPGRDTPFWLFLPLLRCLLESWAVHGPGGGGIVLGQLGGGVGMPGRGATAPCLGALWGSFFGADWGRVLGSWPFCPAAPKALSGPCSAPLASGRAGSCPHPIPGACPQGPQVSLGPQREAVSLSLQLHFWRERGLCRLAGTCTPREAAATWGGRPFLAWCQDPGSPGPALGGPL